LFGHGSGANRPWRSYPTGIGTGGCDSGGRLPPRAAFCFNLAVYVRVDDHNRAVFKEVETVSPLSYEKKGCTIDVAFWYAPERLLDEQSGCSTNLMSLSRRCKGRRSVPACNGEKRTDSAKVTIKAAIPMLAGLSVGPEALRVI
jgi:hypothetical protein